MPSSKAGRRGRDSRGNLIEDDKATWGLKVLITAVCILLAHTHTAAGRGQVESVVHTGLTANRPAANRLAANRGREGDDRLLLDPLPSASAVNLRGPPPPSRPQKEGTHVHVHVSLAQLVAVTRNHFGKHEVLKHRRLNGGNTNPIFSVVLVHKRDLLRKLPPKSRGPNVTVVYRFSSNPGWHGDCKLRNELAAMRLVRHQVRQLRSFWIIFRAFLSFTPPHTRRVMCSTWYPCWLCADW